MLHRCYTIFCRTPRDLIPTSNVGVILVRNRSVRSTIREILLRFGVIYVSFVARVGKIMTVVEKVRVPIAERIRTKIYKTESLPSCSSAIRTSVPTVRCNQSSNLPKIAAHCE